MDFNLSPNHRLTLRNNYIDGVNDLYGWCANDNERVRPADSVWPFAK